MSDIEDFDDDEDFGIDDEGDGFCSECWDTFRYDDCGGYNPPCVCGLHCRHCHEAAEGAYDDEHDERDDEEEFDRLTERFWDSGVGHSADAADNDELPF